MHVDIVMFLRVHTFFYLFSRNIMKQITKPFHLYFEIRIFSSEIIHNFKSVSTSPNMLCLCCWCCLVGWLIEVKLLEVVPKLKCQY